VSLAKPNGTWELTVSCPRPRNRALDDFHTQPEKVARIAAQWFGPDATLTLTARRVRLTCTLETPPRDLTTWHDRLATALHCLYLDTHGDDGSYHLPRPARTEVYEKERAA
jgi:hypothetical protein